MAIATSTQCAPLVVHGVNPSLKSNRIPAFLQPLGHALGYGQLSLDRLNERALQAKRERISDVVKLHGEDLFRIR